MPRCSATAVLLGLLLCSTPRAAAENPPRFLLDTPEGKMVRGPLHHVGEAWQLRLGDMELRASDWLTLRRVGKLLPAHPIDCHLVLTNGDCIPVAARSLTLAGERLTFTSEWLNGGKPTTAPLSSIALIWWILPEQGEDAGTFRRR